MAHHVTEVLKSLADAGTHVVGIGSANDVCCGMGAIGNMCGDVSVEVVEVVTLREKIL